MSRQSTNGLIRQRENAKKSKTVVKDEKIDLRQPGPELPPIPANHTVPLDRIVPLPQTKRQLREHPFFTDASLFDSSIGICLIMGGMCFGWALAGILGVG